MIVTTQDLSRTSRPTISVSRVLEIVPVILHNGSKTRVVFTENTISIGCTDITVEAAEYILEQHKRNFPSKKEVVFQP